MSEAPQRRLAAIMFMDMVGYTALMQQDEATALARRDRCRSVLARMVERHNGQILQHYGDGALSVFASAVQAVQCAIDVQMELGSEPVILVRIGLHTGDIGHDADGVYGDGVNVASRIESLAPPGGVMISGKVYDEIKNHTSIQTVRVGEVRLKHVGRPVQIFAVANEGLPVPSEAPLPAPRIAESAVAQAGGDREPAPRGFGEAFLEHVRDAAMLQWALVYVIGAWAFLETTQFAADVYGWPNLVSRALRLLSFVGFFIAMVVAWYHGERGRQPVRRSELAVIGGLVAAGIIALIAINGLTPQPDGAGRAVAMTDGPPSVAVLPFENLSPDADNAYFASGLHDELLTELQHVAGLRVISRSSVMEYAANRPSIREIADNLGVGYVVEGSVQRIANRLRVNVTLSDARSEINLWSERYDRELDDAFAVQSDVAEKVADAMAGALTAEERRAISREPTRDPEAYRLYVRGRDYSLQPGYRREDFVAAQQAFEQAIALDPDFALAHAELSDLHGRMYWEAFDLSPARLEAQRIEAQEALRLQPDLPQAHIALGWLHYVRGEFRRALSEYQIALDGLPNDAEVIARIGYTHRRLGEWPQVFDAFDRATSLDPRNANLFYDLGGHSFVATRRYAEAAAAYAHALEIAPELYDAGIKKGETFIHWQGQLDSMRAVIGRIPAEVHLPEVDLARLELALWERDGDVLLRVARDTPGQEFETQLSFVPKSLYTAWGHRLKGDEAAARAAFDSARVAVEGLAREHPSDRRFIGTLGLAYAGLGAMAEAARYAEAVTESPQTTGTPPADPRSDEVAAHIFAQAGLADRAVPRIERLLAGETATTVLTLGLDPLLDPVRNTPEFQALLARYPPPEG